MTAEGCIAEEDCGMEEGMALDTEEVKTDLS